jgi:hypothetical protein
MNGTDAVATSIKIIGSDTYISGIAGRTNEGNAGTSALFWKNGQSVSLTNPGTYSGACSIAASDGDIYLAGYSQHGGSSVPTYWKNGTPTQIVSATFQLGHLFECIAVNGKDIYLTGQVDGHPGYWINGSTVVLDPDAMGSWFSNGIVVVPR